MCEGEDMRKGGKGRGQFLLSWFLFPRAIEVVRRVATSRKLHK